MMATARLDTRAGMARAATRLANLSERIRRAAFTLPEWLSPEEVQDAAELHSHARRFEAALSRPTPNEGVSDVTT